MPAWLLAAAQTGLGATVGCRFALTLRTFARVLALAARPTAILLLLTFARVGTVAALMRLDVGLLALAYSPGRLAEMSLIALSLALESGLVTVMRLTRVVLVLIAAPFASRPPTRNPAR